MTIETEVAALTTATTTLLSAVNVAKSTLDASTAAASASAGTAATHAGTATTQAGTATTQAGIATTKAGEASTHASTATTQAGIATTKAGEANASAIAAAASAATTASAIVTERTATATLTNKTLTSPDINGGTVDGAVIGGAVPAAGSFTTLSATLNTASGSSGALGVNVGDYQSLHTASVPTGNASRKRLWSLRWSAGADHMSSAYQTGYSVDTSWDTPSTARTWHKVLPAQGIQQWGDQATHQLTLDASGNLGLGVTPSNLYVSGKTIDITSGAKIYGSITTASFMQNVALDVVGSSLYQNSGYAASMYKLAEGTHAWFTAPSGTAGNPITFTASLAVGLGTTLALEGATSAAGTGIAFPATALLSTNANTLDDYREGTYTATATGMTTSPTGTVTFVRVGNMVTMELPTISGTSNATSFTLTGMPTTIRPSAARIVLTRGQDNGSGAWFYGVAVIDTGGVITLYTNPSVSLWTAVNTKANLQQTISYPI